MHIYNIINLFHNNIEYLMCVLFNRVRFGKFAEKIQTACFKVASREAQ